MHTATWWYRDQRLRETCATQPCVPHGLPDAPLSCSVAQLARRHRTSNVELASRAICDVLAWCPWWTVSRSTRTVSVEVMQQHCVCTVVQTHRVWVICSVIRCVLLVRGTEWIVPWRLQVKAVIGCVFVLCWIAQLSTAVDSILCACCLFHSYMVSSTIVGSLTASGAFSLSLCFVFFFFWLTPCPLMIHLPHPH